MQRFFWLIMRLACALILVTILGALVFAQSGTPARTLDTVNIRSGPDGTYEKLGTLAINTSISIESRNQIGNWALVSDGTLRGWVATRFLAWDDTAMPLANIPVSGEIIGGTPAIEAPAQPAAANTTASAAPVGDGVSARVLADSLNVRTGPESTYAPLGRFARNTNVSIEARNQIGNWALISDGTLRGWVATRFLAWDADATPLANIPVSTEIIGSAPAPQAIAAAPETTTTLNSVPAGLQGQVIPATLNVRQGAASTQTQLGTLTRGAKVTIEARNQIGDWLLVNDGSLRGWVASRFITWDITTSPLANIAVSAEIIGVTPANTAGAATGDTTALAVSGDVGAMEAQLAAVPVIPGVTNRARELFGAALRAGRNPHRFTKVGDCNSENLAFMFGFDWNNYSLGSYGSLQPTVDYFAGSFAQNSVAGKVGYSAVTVIDSLWSDPAVCRSGEAPVYCELRVSNAAFVVIMFGANDISILTPERYEQALRRIIDLSIQAKAVPILSTFPTDPAQPDRWTKSLQLNLITVNVARQYDLPIINFWAVARNLPSAGMSADNAHLTTHSGSTIAFDGSENMYGFTARNLVVLQTLDVIRRDLIGA